jgi:hypothetical protein
LGGAIATPKISIYFAPIDSILKRSIYMAANILLMTDKKLGGKVTKPISTSDWVGDGDELCYPR